MAYHLRTAIATIFPYPIKAIQGIAQYAIMIEIVWLLWLIIRTIRRIVATIFEIFILAIMAFMVYRMYWFWKDDPETFYAKVSEYYAWGLSLLNRAWQMIEPSAQPAQPAQPQ